MRILIVLNDIIHFKYKKPLNIYYRERAPYARGVYPIHMSNIKRLIRNMEKRMVDTKGKVWNKA